MTQRFDGAVQVFTHVVTYPSIWISATPCFNLLVLGGDEQQLNHLVAQQQNQVTQQDWCLYHVPGSQLQDPEHLDWILLHQHLVQATLHLINTLDDLAMSSLLGSSTSVRLHLDADPTVVKMARFSQVPLYASWESCLDALIERSNP